MPLPEWSPAAPHSRACGYRTHDHGISCAVDCPTCRAGMKPLSPPALPDPSSVLMSTALRRLADYVVVQPEYESGRPDGAVDTAIRILEDRRKRLER